MKVMICWSGARSKGVATALRDWLPDVLEGLDPWMSEHDLAAGSVWGQALNDRLEEPKFGILCLTREALHADWLLFEAGALAKGMTTAKVVPYLIDLQEGQVENPLAQFQNVSADEAGTLKLLQSINKARAAEGGLTDERLQKRAELYWPSLESELKKLPEASAAAPPPREVPEMLAEILQIVRGLARPGTTARPLTADAIQSLTQQNLLVLREMFVAKASGSDDPDLMSVIEMLDAEIKRRQTVRIPQAIVVGDLAGGSNTY